MNLRTVTAFAPYVAIILVASLMGFSLTRVDAGAAEHQIGFTLGGAILAALAILISKVFSGPVKEVTTKIPEKNCGMKIGIVSFCVALAGWLVAVLINGKVGFVLVVIGVVAGFIGITIHLASMLRSND